MKYISLNDIAVYKQGKQVPIEKQFLECEDGMKRFVRIIDFTNPSEPPRYIEDLGEQYEVDEKCIIMIRYGSQTAGTVVRGIQGIIANNMFQICIDDSRFDIDYMYYYLVSPQIKQILMGGQSSSTMPAITFGMMKQIQVPIRPIDEQKKIASLLEKIDKKINNNEAINRNLSEQLKVLFEDMFIIKADNTWEDKKLGDFLELERGLSYKGKFLSEGEGVPMLNLGNILPNSVFRPEKLKFYTGEFKPRNVVKPGDIIVANTDLTQAREVLGSAIRVPSLGYDTAICSHHISIVRNCTISNNFILGLLNMPAYRTRVAGFATGTTVLALPNDTILNCEFKCPPDELLKIYDEISEPIYMNMEEIRLENDKLGEIRDSLLPKLMSGELDVSELEYE